MGENVVLKWRKESPSQRNSYIFRVGGGWRLQVCLDGESPAITHRLYIKLEGGMVLVDTLHIITVITAHPHQCNFKFKFQFNLR